MLYEDSNILKDINNINTITNKNDTYDDNGNEYYDDNFVMNDNIFDTHIKKPVTTASSLKFVYDSIKEVKHEIISDKRDNIKRNYKTKLYNNNNILKKANNMNTITNKKYSNDDNGNMYDDENFDMNDRNRRIFSKNIDERNETQSDHSEKENEEEEKEIEEEEEEEEEKEIEEEEKAQKTSMTDNEHLTSKLFFIPNVTAELVESQKLLLASMEHSYNKAQANAMTQISKITQEILTDRPEKVEIFSNSKCYMNESLLAAINLSNNGNKNWKSFVTAILKMKSPIPYNADLDNNVLSNFGVTIVDVHHNSDYIETIVGPKESQQRPQEHSSNPSPMASEIPAASDIIP
ncbi:hypothetical protein PV325_011773 [Microctonus aethiopoides]|nr:hypothetical protein PV325_011773 [Microctonus aethiopoides]